MQQERTCDDYKPVVPNEYILSGETDRVDPHNCLINIAPCAKSVESIKFESQYLDIQTSQVVEILDDHMIGSSS